MTFCLSQKLLFCIRSNCAFWILQQRWRLILWMQWSLHVRSLEFPPSMQRRDVSQSHLSPFTAYPMTVFVCIIYRIDWLNTSLGYRILEGTLVLHTKFLHVLPTSNRSTNGISFGQMKWCTQFTSKLLLDPQISLVLFWFWFIWFRVLSARNNISHSKFILWARIYAVSLHAHRVRLPALLPAVHAHPEAVLVGGRAQVPLRVIRAAADQPRVGPDLSGHHRVKLANGRPRKREPESVPRVVRLAEHDAVGACYKSSVGALPSK